MTSRQVAALLRKTGACEEARRMYKGMDFHTAWTTSKRGDHLLWICGKMADQPGWPTRQQVVLAACDCAETVLKYVPESENRPRIAIETGHKWANGKATIEEVRAAAYAAACAAYFPTYVAYAAAAAIYTAYAAANAAYVAAYVATYTAYAAADASNAADEAYKKCADLVRARIPEPTGESK